MRSRQQQAQSPERLSFQPSWQDRLLYSFSQLPGPRWLSYLLIPLTLFILSHAAIYILEPSLVWKVQGEIANLAFWLAYILVAYSSLQSSSREALNDFRPSLHMDDEEFLDLQERFLALPRPWGWTPLAAFAFAILFVSFRPLIPVRSELTLYVRMIMISLATITFMGLFHVLVAVIRVLKTINYLYSRIVTINIFNLQDLYGLSALSAKVGIFSIIAGMLSYIINVIIPGGRPQIEVAVFFISFNSVMAVSVFLLPLLGIHRRLAEEKQRVARENNRRLHNALQKLHERSDRSQLEEMPLIESQVGALMEFRHEIDKISTWPWQPQTLRGFITAISLPIVIWLIQQYLAQMIGA
jgi:hypothetical protein